MASITIYSSPFIEVTKRDDGFYIQSFKRGFSYEELIRIISTQPNIQITNFTAIKDALIFAPRDAQKFAPVKEKIIVEVSGDQLKAFITLDLEENELGPNIIKDILAKLNEKGVIYGIKRDTLLNLYVNKPILIAEGMLPQPGQDSINKLYQLKEIKPEIKEDGNADHYELNLINMVQKGDWLGEKINATDGVEGRNVYGQILKPMKGKNYPLQYDKKTVKEVVEGNKTVLYALCTGAVYFEGDRIGVSNHLDVKGNVGVKTGNVDFDGYLTIHGTIEDNFSVATTKDIEVLGEYGIGNVKEISSQEGNIYIKGGIAGKGKTVVKCKKNLYLKYVADADIICEGSVHIGFYCLNSNITAKEVILDSMKGKIIGGNINAEIKVVVSILGSASEKRTSICVKGFDRNALKFKLDDVTQKIDLLKAEINQYKQQLAIFSSLSESGQAKKSEFDKLNEEYNVLRTELQGSEENKKNIMGYLRTKGEGEILILKKAFPNSVIEIKNIQKEIQNPMLRANFYYHEGIIKEL